MERDRPVAIEEGRTVFPYKNHLLVHERSVDVPLNPVGTPTWSIHGGVVLLGLDDRS
jgi:hypothetical protein